MASQKLDTDLAAVMVENSLSAMALYREDILYANAAFEKITGYSAEELGAIKIWDIFHPSFRETIKENVSRRLAGADTAGFYHDMKLITKKGKLKWVRSFAKTVPYEGSFAGMLNMYDITDQKLLEIELSDVYKNMAKKVAEAVSTQRKQENLLIQQSKMAAMGEMVAAIAHQWRQPLNLVSLVVQDFAEMFDNPDTTKEDISDTIYFCMNQINYMSQTINDFQNYLKPSNTEVTFDINETVKTTIKLLGDKHLRENIVTTLELSETGLPVTGFENEFKQVLLIILNNAMDAICEKNRNGEVIITTGESQESGQVFVRIEDSAGGIPASIIDKIFDNYFTTKEENGTGLGLYMAKNIIEEHMDGSISVENSERGACFTIMLPRASGHEGQSAF